MSEITIADSNLIAFLRYTLNSRLKQMEYQIREATNQRDHPTKYKSPPWRSRIANALRDGEHSRDECRRWLDIVNA